MKVLFATGEAFPFVKTGGLGDVSYSLPKALVQKEKVDVRVILPKYSKISKDLLKDAKHLGHKEIWVAHHNEYVGIEEVELEGVIYYLVDNEPIYLKERGIYDIKTIFTIHNLRFQGFFFNNVIEDLLEIDRAKYFQEDGLKYYDMISFLKGGVVYSDYVTTVSDSYAEEIKTPELGEGIHGLFQKYDYRLSGIVNGIDKSSYPLFKKSHKTLKADLQKKLGLNVEENTPLVAIITRLDRQKGLDYIVEKFDEMMSLGIQFVLLGTGEKRYEHFFAYQEYLHKGSVCSYIGFNQQLSTEIYAGADIFLMPSVFEPCGLSQMIAMRYGCIPVVRETGGLKDTVKPYNEYTGEGDGFGFRQANADDMIKTLRYAIKMYHRTNVWQEIIKNAKKRDNSWDKPAKRYKELYQRLIEG